MSLRTCSVLVVAWLFSLVAVAAIAQSRGVSPLSEPVVLSGGDIGFRVEGRQGNTPVGKLIIRFDGRWVEPRSVPQPITLASR